MSSSTPQMIKWEFKCLKCGYNFRAIEPRELYEAYKSCAMCGNENFTKRERLL